MKILTFAQGSPEWLEARLGLATASCFDAILAKGKGSEEAVKRRDYRLRLVVERLTGKGIEGFKSAAMQQADRTRAAWRAPPTKKPERRIRGVGWADRSRRASGRRFARWADRQRPGGVEIRAPSSRRIWST